MDTFLSSASLLLIVVIITITFTKSLGLSAILGLLLSGILIGPFTPGPSITNSENVIEIRHFAELGIVLLLFIIGLEMKPKKLWSMRTKVFVFGGLQVCLSGLAIGTYLHYFNYISRFDVSFLIGFTLSLSSTALVMQLLNEKGEFASTHGKNAFAILLFQDLAVVPLLAIVPIISNKGKLDNSIPLSEQIFIILATLIIIYICGKFLANLAFKKIAKQNNSDTFLFLAILTVIFSAYLTSKAGLSMALGAFMMGMLLSTSKYNFQIQASIEPFKGILMGLFFVAVGMSIDFDTLMEAPIMLLTSIVIIMLIKTVILFLLSFLFKNSMDVNINLSFLLNQSGEFGFVLFGAAKSLELINDKIFVFGIGFISISMLISPVLYNLALRLSSKISNFSDLNYLKKNTSKTHRIVIAGYGYSGQIIANLLDKSNIEFIAFDTDINMIEKGRKNNHMVFLGDISNHKLLEIIKIEQADMLILTINKNHKALKIIKHIKKTYPQIKILARAININELDTMNTLGADWVISENAESSLKIGEKTLEYAGIKQENIELLLNTYRNNDYDLIRKL